MNTTLIKNDLSQLMEQRRTGPVVSIYLSTRTVINDLSHQLLQFQHLIKEAQQSFAKYYPKLDFAPYQVQLENLLINNTFWLEHTAPQMGIIVSKNGLATFDLHFEGNSQVSVSDKPAILPILADYQFQSDFDILCLNEDNFVWYQYRQGKLYPIKLSQGAPDTLKNALGEEIRGGNLNFNSSNPNGPSYHGHNAKSEEKEIDQHNYYQMVDNYTANHFSKNNRLPMILFSLQHNQTIYRKVSKNPYLSEVNIAKSPIKLNEQDIIRELKPVQEAIFNKKNTKLLERFDKAYSQKLVVTAPLKLIKPALAGQIDTLIINQQANNLENLMNNDLQKKIDVNLPDNLMNDLADTVFENQGHVWLLSNEKMPVKTEAVAILRYQSNN